MLPPAWSRRTFSCPTVHVAGQRPVIGPEPSGELVVAAPVGDHAARRREALATAVAEVGLRRAEVLPVGGRLDPDLLDRDEVPIEAEEALDRALGALVVPFAELVVTDQAVLVHEVERRPVVVVERAPDGVVVVDDDRVVDPPLRRSPTDTRSTSCSKENSGVCTPMTTSPSSR